MKIQIIFRPYFDFTNYTAIARLGIGKTTHKKNIKQLKKN